MPTTMQAFPAAVTATATAATEALTPPDFDFQMPSCFFKSSFARSLSLSNRNCGGNGNGSNAFALEPPILMIKAIERQLEQEEDVEQGQVELEDTLPSPCMTPPPALPARRYTTSSSCGSGNNSKNNNLTHFNIAPANQLQQQNQQQPQQQPQRNLNRSIACVLQDAAPNNSNNNYHLPQQQTQPPQQVGTPQPPHEQSLNVEAVILQNQVDTLQWQLKQSEKNCEMYRAVMEEVARFLERYQQQQQQQQQLQQQQQQQSRQQQLQMNRLSLGGIGEISRSKSLHHVHGVQGDPNGYTESPTGMSASNSCSSSYLRARSSTNLMLNKSMLTMNEDHNYETIAPAGSYNAFKDFTWRRSPKKLGGCKARLSSPEAAEEKLNQEAFRLSRTIRNLLHTSQQQPDLTQPRHSMPGGGAGGLVGAGGLPHHLHRLCMQKTSSVLTLHNSSSLNATLDASFNPLTSVKTGNNSNISTTATPTSATPTTAEMLFLRANTMRDSRLSLRSSTDSSVHSTISSTASSTSSSKLETDEEITAITTGNSNSNKQSKSAVNSNSTNNNNNNNGSSTEDESGFSSISSFHDVGLPMSSTLIADNQNNNSSRNSTLKSAGNVVGVPQQLSPNQSLSSQSSTQSPSKTYRNANRYQRFSTLSTEDAAAVLWV